MIKNTIDCRFFEVAETYGENIALKYCGEDTTYADLAFLIDKYKSVLRGYSIGCKDVIGVLLPRSPMMVAIIFAIMSLGAAFVPIDEKYPRSLIKYIFSKSKCRFIITRGMNNGFEHEILTLDDLHNKRIFAKAGAGNQVHSVFERSSHDAAYHIYTSGSTGNPKGVMVKHESVVSLVNNAASILGMTSGRSIPFISSISFDLAMFELVFSLCVGMTVIIATEKESSNPMLLARLIGKSDVLALTPSRFKQLMLVDKSGSFLKEKKSIIFGGEIILNEILFKIRSITDALIFNTYGPSETTMFATYADLTKTDEISIGIPVSGTDLFILDKKNKPVPNGIKGQIAISGIGVSLGYANSPEVTAQNFIQNEKIAEGIIYLTGDLGYKKEEGCFVYCGRTDNQLKYLGNRIELEEIESKAALFAKLDDCLAIMFQESGQDVLCLFYTTDISFEQTELKEHLKKELPRYMLPNLYIQIDKIPANHNGKAQRDVKLLSKYLPKKEGNKDVSAKDTFNFT
ncbi:MAG: amino acid adenylation domain-containing protein [Lachnospiraceae bacterium]|nr:amino acid adenylation domain-containing protein [Lachnospiraceae bacterium]